MTDLTVVMATYRQRGYLMESLKSLRGQFDDVLNPKTILVVVSKELASGVFHDDIARFAGTFITVPKPNLWTQRQTGLMGVDTPYISFFDSDDVMLPSWLEKGLKVATEIASRGKIPIVGPSYRMVDEKLFPIQDVILPDFTMDRMMEGSIIPDFSITKTENLRVAFEAGCKVAREQFTPQYSMYCTWLEMLKRFDCEVKLLPDIGFLYRQHRGGMHNRFKNSKRASRKNVEMVKKIARHYFPNHFQKGDGDQ